MNKYEIDYGRGVAYFWTDALDARDVQGQFYRLAGECFGIRKSISAYEVLQRYQGVELPIPYRDKGATHLLEHSGDIILFDDAHRCPNGNSWKLLSETGEWCSCQQRGSPELACSCHHFWVENHDQLCQCKASREQSR